MAAAASAPTRSRGTSRAAERGDGARGDTQGSSNPSAARGLRARKEPEGGSAPRSLSVKVDLRALAEARRALGQGGEVRERHADHEVLLAHLVARGEHDRVRPG